MEKMQKVAYFSMEIALSPDMPTYSGGLGVLAGDTLTTASDLQVPIIAISLLYRKGYFDQKLNAQGEQEEVYSGWNVDEFLEEMSERASVAIEGRTVHIRGWKFAIKSKKNYEVPVYFLDTDLPENAEQDRALTDYLYGGDQTYRLSQEIILGIGGVRILRALRYSQIERFHMNEGHSSLLTLELFDEIARSENRETILPQDIDRVRKKCVFTTHTPVPSGHDQYSMDLVIRLLGRKDIYEMKDVFCCDGVLNLTFLALNLSHYVNGVAKKHGETSRLMFANYPIHSITNGVNTQKWTCSFFQSLYDKHIPSWRDDNFSFRNALKLPPNEIWQAHLEAKRQLFEYISSKTGSILDVEKCTIGFARRSTHYKRSYLIFENIDRLKQIASETGPIQIVFAGKAHPQDQEGKSLIQKIFQIKEQLKDAVEVVYLENYNTSLAQLMTSGVDIWLNTPQIGLEASGTSGMKAALNGVPSLSILDGWWVEGWIENITGWAINKDSKSEESNDTEDGASLLDQLENTVLPTYYQNRDRFISMMLHSIALNGSFFNSQRMLYQYVMNAYFL